MAKIQITPSELLSQSAEMAALSQEFRGLFGNVSSVLKAINTNWSANLANNFEGKISTAGKTFNAVADMLENAGKIAANGAHSFANVDQILANAINGADANGVIGSSASVGVAATPIQGPNFVLKTGFLNGVLKTFKQGVYADEYNYFLKDTANLDYKVSFKPKGGAKTTIHERPSWGEDDIHYYGKYGDDSREYKDQKYAEKKMNSGKKVGTIYEAKVEASASASIYEGRVGNENANASMTVGKIEAHANASAGFYVYDKNGNKYINPSIQAEIGTSVTVLNVKGEAKVGNDMLGAGVEGEVTVGKAEAKATAGIGLRDGSGKINPKVSVEASAEAIAAEASASAKVNLAGTEVKATGTVNVGVGAHAKVGYQNGVIKCDIGASLGLGFSVKAEVDISGTIDKAVDAYKKVANSGAVKAAKGVVSGIGKGVSKLFKR